MPEAVLELRNLVRGYAQPVLTGVDLAVPRGTVRGLLGRNGAGKSTLLKCGLGILVPESGSATVFGEPAVALDEAAKERIGYVPQALSVFTWMRVRELNPRLIESLCTPDQKDHVAWVAMHQTRDDIPGVGGASFWRLQDEPEAAEVKLRSGSSPTT